MARTRIRFKGNWTFIRNPIPKQKERIGNRQGALVRRIGRRNVRSRKRASRPGEGPTNQTGLLKRFIFYSWDPINQAIVVGPEKLSGVVGSTPKVLEFGGTNLLRGGRTARYAARPFMRPALAAAKDSLPELWRNAIR